jgi:hypothetical protein
MARNMVRGHINGPMETPIQAPFWTISVRAQACINGKTVEPTKANGANSG